VVAIRIVEIDRLLHKPHTENARVEIDVFLRVTGDGRNVVNTIQMFHGITQLDAQNDEKWRVAHID
jgi:hypothetical protein